MNSGYNRLSPSWLNTGICKPCFLYFCSHCSDCSDFFWFFCVITWRPGRSLRKPSTSPRRWTGIPAPNRNQDLAAEAWARWYRENQRNPFGCCFLHSFTIFHMSIDVSRCFPTFPTFGSLQEFSDSQPNLKSSSVAFAGGTVITILVVLAWPQESQAIVTWLCQPIFGHGRLELPVLLHPTFGTLWYIYIYILWSSRSVDPCWTWLCGLQVLHPAAAGDGTGDWGTTEVFSASTVSVLWTGTPAATTKRQQANLVARISQCYDSCQKADFLPFHWPTVDLSLMNALSKPLSRSWCCDVLCDFPLDLQQLNQPLHGVRSVQMSGWDMNPFAHYSLLIIVTYYAVWSYCLFCCWFCQSCRRDLRAVWTTRCWSLETRLPSFRRLLCLKRPIEEVACLSFEAVDLWRFKAHLWSTASVKKNGYAVLIQLHARC